MRPAHPREQVVGIDHYVSDTAGVGGRLRNHPEDFRVRELETVSPEPLEADPTVYEHLLVRATLRDRDTHQFARELSNRLGISRERISWAGTKDKRAITTQVFSIHGIESDELPELSNVSMEPIGRLGRKLLLGDLAGNEFQVTIADPSRPQNAETITEELIRFGDGIVGVPNFFGQQRFGSRRPVSHEVGLRIVRRDWQGAVMAYVGNPFEDEPDETRAAREFIEKTRDWAAALDRFPEHLQYERAMLHSLVETGGSRPGDFLAALESLPRNLQQLFVHAAQSLAFNRMLSERLRRGLPFARAVVGDVVCFAEETAGLTFPNTDRLQRVTEENVEIVNRHCERGRAFVVATLIGTETNLAEGEPGEIERTVIEDLGLEPADFDLPGAFGSSGIRRAIHVRTDLSAGVDPLQFSFALPRGSYATVLLREYLKVSPTAL